MPKSWSDVASNPDFQALPQEDKAKARDQYFDSVVAPNVPEDKRDSVKDNFLQDVSGSIGAPTGGPSYAAELAKPLTYAEHEISEPVESAWKQLKDDFKASVPDKAKWKDEGLWERMKDQFRANVAAGKVPVDAFNLVTAPIAGAVHGTIIKPVAEGMTYGLNHLIPGFMDEKKAEEGIGQALLMLGPEGEEVSPLAAGKAPLKGGAAAPKVAAAPTSGPATLAPAKPALASRQSPLKAALDKPGTPPQTAAQIGIPPDSNIGRAADKAAAPKQFPQPTGKYAENVKKLQQDGVDLTLGQTHGGTVRRAEEAHKSNPLTGNAIREAENRSIQTYNRAWYNKVLAPIGEKFEGDEIGRTGIGQVVKKVDAAYERIKPKLKLSPDDTFLEDMAKTREEASEMPEPQEKQFENIVNNRLLKRIGPDGNIDGSTFKQIESELTHLSSVYKSSGDAAHRELGAAIQDVVTNLRENLERSSDPSVREELKKINTSWAMLTRLESAAARRAGSGGVFTTGDMLQAVKSGDKSARRRTFARGDALMQDFAETAHSVLPDRLPDSGTAERQMWNNLTGVMLRGVGTATNPLYKRAAEVMKKTYAEPPAP